MSSPAYSQPLCTALQIALIELLQNWGVRPTAVVGHSSGEIAAAYAIGALSLESACKVAYFRGTLAASLISDSSIQEAMMSVGLPEDEARCYIARTQASSGTWERSSLTNYLVVSCINSPKNVTISGNEAKIDVLKATLDAEEIFARKLNTGVGYHSPQMELIAAEYRTSMGKLQTGTPVAGEPKMVSSVTGELISPRELCVPAYWVINMVSPVKFVSAILRITSQSPKALARKLNRSHHSAILTYDLIEMGPHSALRGPIKETLSTITRGGDITYATLLVRDMPAMETSLDTMARLHRIGYPISLRAINHQGKRANSKPVLLPSLPEYPFDHTQSYWCESHLSSNFRLRKHPRVDLLGTPAVDWNPSEAKWRKLTRLSETPWVQDHKINSTMIYPAAGMLVMAIEGIRQLMFEEIHTIRGYRLTDVTFSAPLIISSDDETETQLHMRQLQDASDKTSGRCEFRVYLHKDSEWAETCRGIVSIDYKDRNITEVDGGRELTRKNETFGRLWKQSFADCCYPVDKSDMYEYLRNIGLDYGPSFQAMNNIACSDDGQATAEIQVFELSSNESVNSVPVIHPVTLDAVAQLLFVALSKGGKEDMPTTIPTRITDCWISNEFGQESSPTVLQACTRSIRKGFRNTESEIFALDRRSGRPFLSIAKLESTTVSSELRGQENPGAKQQCYHLSWQPDVSMMSNEEIQYACTKGRMAALCPANMRNNLPFLIFTLIVKAYNSVLKGAIEVQDPVMRDFRQWMIQQIQSFAHNRLAYSLPEWKALAQDTEAQKSLLMRLIQQDGEAKWLITVGLQLPYILQGSIDIQIHTISKPHASRDELFAR
ncbi:polyketide synthase dehydratase-domain-containing protein [Lophiotrema nucula]|uniref:Polyketide synthase dehydratase-domain-containing protein n=1 Tax=Lophiotrema nucula TaxID=690887 RepID=A0A6A5ZEG4_9PLEO|nr:polyketide synthase dehydratase-domain-containing protein [Lophiotrema nucula]